MGTGDNNRISVFPANNNTGITGECDFLSSAASGGDDISFNGSFSIGTEGNVLATGREFRAFDAAKIDSQSAAIQTGNVTEPEIILGHESQLIVIGCWKLKIVFICAHMMSLWRLRSGDSIIQKPTKQSSKMGIDGMA